MNESPYNDDDFVYVDPEKRVVVGIVEWDKDGNAIPKEKVFEGKPKHDDEDEGEQKGKRKFKRRKSYYPWGSYKTMKKVHRIEGKQKEEEGQKTLDDVIEKAMVEPYWD